MFKSSSQAPYLGFCGYILCPLFFLIPFFFSSPISYNYTGILNSSLRHTMIFPFFAFLFLSFLTFKAGKKSALGKRWEVLFWVTEISCIVTLLFPYSPEENTLSSLHLLFAFAALILVNLTLSPLLVSHPSFAYFYIGGTFFSACLAFSAMSINGLSELAYACVLSVTVTRLCTQKKQTP